MFGSVCGSPLFTRGRVVWLPALMYRSRVGLYRFPLTCPIRTRVKTKREKTKRRPARSHKAPVPCRGQCPKNCKMDCPRSPPFLRCPESAILQQLQNCVTEFWGGHCKDLVVPGAFAAGGCEPGGLGMGKLGIGGWPFALVESQKCRLKTLLLAECMCLFF